MIEPNIVEIKRHSLEDGPGIRSVVFFKGCGLRCVFCQNPEAQEPGIEISFSKTRCISCGRCLDACKNNAIRLDEPGRIRRDLCKRCGECAVACPSSALRVVGQRYSISDLVRVLLRDEAYYRASGGGVTLSGGEPGLYCVYAGSLLRELKKSRVHTAVQTSGYFDQEAFCSEVLRWSDLVLFDLKMVDAGRHVEATGVSNRSILENLKRLMELCPEKVLCTMPVIPGVTDDEANIEAVAGTIAALGGRRLLPRAYNPLGIPMLAALGRPSSALPERFLTFEEKRRIQKVFTRLERRSNTST